MHTTVLAFRSATGHYAFRERGFVTSAHAHPNLEVVYALAAKKARNTASFFALSAAVSASPSTVR